MFSFLFFSFVYLSKAQFDIEKYDKEAFLIGTLNDYLGFQRVFTEKSDSFYYQRVYYYSNNGLKLALFVDSLFN